MSEPVEILRSAPADAVGTAPSGGSCGCGEHADEIPVLDVRGIPHAVRHGAVFGAFDQVRPGASLVIIAPHAPMPLLAQLSKRAPIETEFLTEGPLEWRVLITRLAA
ncbi:conserved hypothetical protein [Xylanimonas cellulosilytica DSM 15894]|uniref:DUF2249 domain-containing protein n=1 Tax=Xylanimonas cellulosilytica (strain DSM 15894 / JCM 12276 / CECT 5975 / KCTC 9989 / LMG 20990 / NBRC 107835 / XIL07) TaxID=446471 RepID=D1BSG8_XYLCX|nr:DUF2249 domain-containing protein [Xylanimonas cellulosilytica]ACZ30660.1 conserved hypothetical protein [Xylanimonas cellulosilytica DSM 15894]